jgi:CMP-N-acetylneuraminic acid synthetase
MENGPAANRHPVLGLIPAKGGSTRLPRKNIARLGGKPLIAWSADAARASGLIDRLILSTEDAEVAEIARQHDIDVPFLRPEKLAKDPAGIVQVALHALAELRKAGQEYKTLVILLPTCPFRDAQDIKDAFALYERTQAQFLMSVSLYPHTPFAAMKLSEAGRLEPYFPEYIGKRSQEMPAAYRANGALHILDVAAFEQAKSYYAQPLIGYAMPWEKSVDIDTAEDWQEAEMLLARKQAAKG